MGAIDPILRKARRMTFHYSEDFKAFRELERRLAAVGRREELITYSDLVKGVIFHLPGVQEGNPVELGAPDWSDLHRAIIGGCLGRISCDTYQQGRFLASALAVSKATGEPSEGFRALLEDLGLVGSRRDARCLDIWVDQSRKAYNWFRKHPSWPEPEPQRARLQR